MTKSIAVFGAGPALGRAVAQRYAKEGYSVALVARRPETLHQMAEELSSEAADVHAFDADLSDTQAAAPLAERIRAEVGDLDVLYYGPSAGGILSGSASTVERIQAFMPLALYTPVALIEEFLPHMIAQGKGAILVATGASAVRGMPAFRAAGPGLAAQRNYLESLEVELSGCGVYVGRLYIGATIERSAWYARIEAERAAGRPVPAGQAIVAPEYLAELLWSMHTTTRRPEVLYPDNLFEH